MRQESGIPPRNQRGRTQKFREVIKGRGLEGSACVSRLGGSHIQHATLFWGRPPSWLDPGAARQPGRFPFWGCQRRVVRGIRKRKLVRGRQQAVQKTGVEGGKEEGYTVWLTANQWGRENRGGTHTGVPHTEHGKNACAPCPAHDDAHTRHPRAERLVSPWGGEGTGRQWGLLCCYVERVGGQWGCHWGSCERVVAIGVGGQLGLRGAYISFARKDRGGQIKISRSGGRGGGRACRSSTSGPPPLRARNGNNNTPQSPTQRRS